MPDWISLADLRHLDLRLFNLGGATITLFGLIWIVTLLTALVLFAGWLRHWTARRLLARTPLDVGTQQAIGAVLRYAVLAMGVLAIAQTAGINLTTFNVLAGAIVIGVGFGLQTVINNFVSGLIIIFERPIRVGDRVEIAGVEGSIEDIGTRRTTILTNDNISIIVPNQRFLTDNVVKLPDGTMPIRLRVPIAVKPGADPRVVEGLLLEAARENPDVLEQPPPVARLLAVSGNLSFELHVWNSKLIRSRDQLVSALNFAILEKLARADIPTA